jgi:outer membrane protein assembly factor BamB
MDIMAKNWWGENNLRIYWNTLWAYGIAPEPSPRSGFLWGINLGRMVRAVSSPSIDGDFAYVGSGTDLVSIDLINHKVQWRFVTGNDVTSSPLVVGNVVYVGSLDGHFYAIDKLTGEKLWDYDIGNQITSSPAIYNGKVYVGSHDGKMYCFE